MQSWFTNWTVVRSPETQKYDIPEISENNWNLSTALTWNSKTWLEQHFSIQSGLQSIQRRGEENTLYLSKNAENWKRDPRILEFPRNLMIKSLP